MSGNLFGDLSNATKALTAHRFGVTTAGNNLANVNNPDYARQRVVIGEDGMINTVFGPRGLGVEVQAFEHARDSVLDREVLRESSINASLTAQQSALAKAESNLGQEINRTGDSPFIDGASDGSGTGGIAETLNDFFNAFHSLSANPGSDAEKEALVQTAQILSEKLNVTSERFSDLRDDLTLEAETDLGDANRIIEEIARLNSEIARAESSSAGQALSLRDQRQALLEDLSEYMQIKVEDIEGSSGQVRVYVPTIGEANPQFDLVNLGRHHKVSFDDSGVSPSFTVKEGTIKVEIKNGSIGGALTARDGAIADYSRGLDNLAGEIVENVNSLYNGYKSTANVASALAGKLGGEVSSSSIEAAIAASASGTAAATTAATELMKDATISASYTQTELEDMIADTVSAVEYVSKIAKTGATDAEIDADVTTWIAANAATSPAEVAELASETVSKNQNNFFRQTSTSVVGESIAKELGLNQSATSLQDAIDTDVSGASELDIAANLIHTNLGAGSPGLSEVKAMIEKIQNYEQSAGGMSLDSDLDATTLRTSNSSYELGDNSLTLKLAELDELRIDDLGGRKLSTFYRSTVTTLGERVAKVESQLDDEQIVFNLLKEQQDSVSGVSMDEEMTDMMKFQRAYEATGKYIKAIDEMLDVIINRLI